MLVGIDLNNFGEDSVLSSIRNSDSYKEENFRNIWYDYLSRASRIVTASKIYIIDNYKKISDYSDLHLTLIHNKGKQYIGPKRENRTSPDGDLKISSRKSEVLERLMMEIDAITIQIDTFDEAVYDWTDGDFSVTFNGVNYLWIDDESLILIASYIEKKLKDGNNDKL
jgi:hypothetical protein